MAIYPGDIISFTGIVGGVRGVLLVIEVSDSSDPKFKIVKTIKCFNEGISTCRYSLDVDNNEENESAWFRINER